MDFIGRYICLIVSRVSKASESFSVEVNIQRAIAGTKNIEPQVEFFLSKQKGIFNVFLTNICFCLQIFTVFTSEFSAHY